MLDQHSIRNIIGIVGNVLSFGLFISPSPTFYKIWKKKAVEGFKPDPYIATIMNCMLWVFYGLPIVHPDSTLIVTINGIGLLIETVYLSLYFYYAPKNGRKKLLLYVLVEAVAMAAIVSGVLIGEHTHEKRTNIVGILCVIFGCFMYASPLTIMGKVFKTKSVKYMPFFLSLANFLNGIDWTLYAVVDKFDIFVVIPNGVGVALGLLQLLLYVFFKYLYPKIYGAESADDDKLPTSVAPPSNQDSKVEFTAISSR